MYKKLTFSTALILLFCWSDLMAYPIDGYNYTGIRRLLRLELMEKGEIDGFQKLTPGSTRKMADIELLLCGRPVREDLETLPEQDSVLQEKLDDLMQRMNPNYSITVLDLTVNETPIYAARRPEIGYQPGSVGKLAVLTGLFAELEKVYPNDFKKQQQLLKNKYVEGGKFAVYDHHTVPFFDTVTYAFNKRVVRESDVFSLYEWADHMTSVSNNGAASIVWREAMLMRIFGKDYPDLTQEKADLYFKETPRDSLARVANRVVNEPLRALNIAHDEWRLGSMFTRGASSIVPPMGGSIGTPLGLMKWLLALERGDIVGYESSLEMKRLIYMSDRRIRYARAEVLDSAAVCFKSGSLYSFLDGTPRKKYAGTRYNYMNSVAIVEHRDGSSYLVAMESNVKGKNSAYDHYILATRIDGMLRKHRKREEINAVLKGEVD
jgi:hypothetical protein